MITTCRKTLNGTHISHIIWLKFMFVRNDIVANAHINHDWRIFRTDREEGHANSIKTSLLAARNWISLFTAASLKAADDFNFLIDDDIIVAIVNWSQKCTILEDLGRFKLEKPNSTFQIFATVKIILLALTIPDFWIFWSIRPQELSIYPNFGLVGFTELHWWTSPQFDQNFGDFCFWIYSVLLRCAKKWNRNSNF